MVEAMEVQEGIKQTEVGLIPNDWDVISLENLSIRIGDGIHTTPKYTDSADYFFVNGNNLKDGKIVITVDTKRVSRDEYLKHKRELNSATVLISINGTIGNIAFYNNENIVLGKSVAYVNLNDKIEKILLYQIIQTEFIKNYFENELTGSTIKNLGLGSIRNTPIPLPPTKVEQTAIATALNDADVLITQLEKLIAKKRAIKQGALQELLKPKVGWEVKKLGDCLKQNPDYGINAAAVPYHELLPVYLRITDITEDGKYSKNNLVSIDNIYSSNYYLEKGDLVFARTGASVGKTYLYKANDGKLVFAGFLIRIKTNPEILIPEYFQYYTQTSNYWNWIRTNSMRTGQPGINGNEYTELSIIIPTIDEQIRIAQILSYMDAEIDALQNKLEKYKMIKQGMMQNLLTGKIRLV